MISPMNRKATQEDWEAVIGYLPRYNQVIYKQPKGKSNDKLKRPAGSLSSLASPASSPRTQKQLRGPPHTSREHRLPSKSDRPMTARPRLPALAGNKSVVHLPDKVPDDDGVRGDLLLPSMTRKRILDSGAMDLSTEGNGLSMVENGSDAPPSVDVCHEWLSELETSARTIQPRGPQNCTHWILDVRQNELSSKSEKMLHQMQSTSHRKRVLAFGKSPRSTAPARDTNWMQYLKSLSLLAGMKQSDLDEVYARLSTEEFARGSYVLHQHQAFGNDVFVIFRGTASAFYTDSDCRQKKVATLREHASIGNAELSCCPSTPLGFNADVIADTELACLRIPRKLIGSSEIEVVGHGRSVSPLTRSPAHGPGQTRAAETHRRVQGLRLTGFDRDDNGDGDGDDLSRLTAGRAGSGAGWLLGAESRTVEWVISHQMLQKRVVVTESRQQVSDFVSQIDLFRSVSRGDLRRNLFKLQFLYFLEGDKLLQQGERGGSVMFVMYAGRAEGMQYSARTGEMKSIAHYTCRDQFGCGAVLKSDAYEASVFARSDCKLIGIPRTLLLELGLFEEARRRFVESRGDMDWEALRPHFGAYDKDDDGVLDREELLRLMGRLGFRYERYELELGLTMMQTKLGGTVDFDTFKEFWQRCNFLDPLNVRQLGENIRDARSNSIHEESSLDGAAGAAQPNRSEEEEAAEAVMAQAAEEARSLWLRYDVDASNALDKYEFRMLLIDLGFGDCSAARIEREMATMDKDNNGQIDFEEFLYWWMPAKLQSQLESAREGARQAPAGTARVQTHHPSLELPDATVRAFFDLLHKDVDGQVSVIDMMKGVSLAPLEAAEFGFLAPGNEVDKEKVVVAFDAMRQPGVERVTADDMVNYFGPKGRHRGGGGLNSESLMPRSANNLWAAVRSVL